MHYNYLFSWVFSVSTTEYNKKILLVVHSTYCHVTWMYDWSNGRVKFSPQMSLHKWLLQYCGPITLNSEEIFFKILTKNSEYFILSKLAFVIEISVKWRPPWRSGVRWEVAGSIPAPSDFLIFKLALVWEALWLVTTLLANARYIYEAFRRDSVYHLGVIYLLLSS